MLARERGVCTVLHYCTGTGTSPPLARVRRGDHEDAALARAHRDLARTVIDADRMDGVEGGTRSGTGGHGIRLALVRDLPTRVSSRTVLQYRTTMRCM